MLLALAPRTTTITTLVLLSLAGCTHADAGDDAATATEGGASGNADDGNDADEGSNADDGNAPAMPLGPTDAQLVPDNLMTCADGFPVQINPTFPQPFTGEGSSSCTLLTYSSVQPTTGGTVVSANIGVGPTTGPMRFVRMRILEQPGTGTACCSAEEFGDMFTPDANAVTTVPLGFVFEADTDVETQIRYADWIALEVLAPDVPIPGIWTANGGGDLMLPDYLWLPALSTRSAAPTQNLRSEGSYSGFLPTFNISFVPAQ